jgi:hypothetical protein
LMKKCNCVKQKPNLLTNFGFHRFNKLLTPWNRVLLQQLKFLSCSKNSPYIRDPEGTLPYSKQPSTSPYPKQREYTLCYPILFL